MKRLIKKKSKLKVMCHDCGKKEYKIRFAEEPVFALTHGFGTILLCRQCYINRIEEGIKVMQANLEKEKKLLVKEK